MRKMLVMLVAGFLMVVQGNAATNYVDVASTNPVSPYSSWATAATSIQHAVNVAANGDTVLVNDGHYVLLSTINIYSDDLTVQSVNGSGVTIVDGNNICRVFNLSNRSCVISGFTITNGYSSSSGGGVYCFNGSPALVKNCTISGNDGGNSGGGMYYGTVSNCTISGNSSEFGGGLYYVEAYNCIISKNSSIYSGGGLLRSTANNCVISDNLTGRDGGGVSECTINNCVVSGNSAGNTAGGIYSGTANNCTISGNSASSSGGGVQYGTVNNCIIWQNHPDNLYYPTVQSSCSPDAQHGSNGNITNNPLLVSSSHIATNSPCRGAGNSAYASGTDIDDDAWHNPPSMGCDEKYDGETPSGDISLSLIGPVTVLKNRSTMYGIQVLGNVSEFSVDFDNGITLTNIFYTHNTWTSTGTYDVVLSAYNDDYPAGFMVTQVITVVNADDVIVYVNKTGSDTNNGASWATAKATIQAGIDAQLYAGGTVKVGDGLYVPAAMTSIKKSILLQSLNGAAHTVIDGDGVRRCLELIGNCVVSGFTITNGYTYNGGGVYCANTTPRLENCNIVGNRAEYGGGGMYYGTAINCLIRGNSASYAGGIEGGVASNCVISANVSGSNGGGIREGMAYNCVISGNSSGQDGGGMSRCTANNCTVSGNVAGRNGGGISGGTMNNSISIDNQPSDTYFTTAFNSCAPDITHGSDGNITDNPMMVSSSHIATNSPCRSAGSSAYAAGTDIDGDAWQIPPSMGCDEKYDGETPSGDISLSLIGKTLTLSGYPRNYYAQVLGNVSQFSVDFDNGIQLTNIHSSTFVWDLPGEYNVVISAYNNDYPTGVTVTQIVTVVDADLTAIYVSKTGDDANDGTNWITAKATIQAGVNLQQEEGGIVYVGDGNYMPSATIVITNNIRLLSQNGATHTIVDGGGTNRCFDLQKTFCEVNGFTITNGYHTSSGGGIYCSFSTSPRIENSIIIGNHSDASGGGVCYGTVNNCTISDNSAVSSGGGVSFGTANNCIIIGNSANSGGGVYLCTVTDCAISSNSAINDHGGGIYQGTANGCIISDNDAKFDAGGAYNSILDNCLIKNNYAERNGGGVSRGTINRCIITGNSSPGMGGGLNEVTANNCSISANTSLSGGGAYHSTVNNCTITGNSSGNVGGGFYWGTINNSIVWYNSPSDIQTATVRNSCSPDVTHGGSGNITNSPALVSTTHIATNSPCRGAGDFAYASGTDIDGDSWQNPPSMGCDEKYVGETASGSISLSLSGPLSLANGYLGHYFINIAGNVSSFNVDFGSGTIYSNTLNVTSSWSLPGDYDVVLKAYNVDYPAGLIVTQTIQVVDQVTETIYVSTTGNNINDGSSWAAAKETIQAGVDAQLYEGGVILVASGTYAPTSTITVHKNIRLQSQNGAEHTTVDGGGTIGCFDLGGSLCEVDGFTITGGNAYNGGGVSCYYQNNLPVVKNCFIIGNHANYGGGMYSGTANHCIFSDNRAKGGGGVYYSTVNNCSIYGNEATENEGGGMSRSIANNCTISGNTGISVGGVYSSTINNCTVVYNVGQYSGGVSHGAANNSIVWYNTPNNLDNAVNAKNSCAPNTTHGVDGNITNVPALVSYSHIATNSPCRGAGNSAYVSGTDIDGDAWQSPPSIGCDEKYDGETTGGDISLSLGGPKYVLDNSLTTFRIIVIGNVSQFSVDFDNGNVFTNAFSAETMWATTGYYDVVISAFNNDYPAGITVTQVIEVVDASDLTIYVSKTGDDAQDGRSWATAKATIQAGINTQQEVSGIVRVGDGLYIPSATITINKEIRLLSQNGAEHTMVDGAGTKRCFNLYGSSCIVSGFTITNGYSTSNGGGISCNDNTPVIESSVFIDNLSDSSGGAVSKGTLNDCIIIGNSAQNGGGIISSTISNSVISGNTAAIRGGGLYGATAIDCTVSWNSASVDGGGLYSCTATDCLIGNNSAASGGGAAGGMANNCTITSNTATQNGGGLNGGTANYCEIRDNSSARYGGGIYSSTVNNSIISKNSAQYGGGASHATLHNCAISENTATEYYGGGTYYGSANNCTISGNSADKLGGGMYRGTAKNCVVWHNDPSDMYIVTASNSCSADVTHEVDGNITNTPILVSASHISTNSPCRGAGSYAYTSGSDIDGEVWLNPPSMGCDEVYSSSSMTGELTVAIGGQISVIDGYPIELFADITGMITEHTWSFGDGIVVTNDIAPSHLYSATGSYSVALTAYNETYPAGISATQIIQVLSLAEAAIYVSTSGDDGNDGVSWVTAKATIQAGVDAQLHKYGIVYVSNGTYLVSAEIEVNKDITIEGLNGAQTTIIDGGGTKRCFNLGDSECVVKGFTITNGYHSGTGGGIYCDYLSPALVEYCIISGNSAGDGGGIAHGFINNSLISGNSAESGGGAHRVTAENCTIIRNSAENGGGMNDSTANSCVITENTATKYGGGICYSIANNCSISENYTTVNGGGMYYGSASNCIITDNTAGRFGGGLGYVIANNCCVSGNSSGFGGGGVYSGTANNCTVTGNITVHEGGGMRSGTANNCIVWHNSSPEIYYVTISNSCSLELTHGEGNNITNVPMLVSASHIATNSPCRAVGNFAYTSGTDIDGDTWQNPPSMGCDEKLEGESRSGPILLSLSGPKTVLNVHTASYFINVVGNVTEFLVDFDNGAVLTNVFSTTFLWSTPGFYDVVLTAFNDDYPAGVVVTQVVEVIDVEDVVIHVSTSGNNTNDGASWATAKATIQAGVDAQLYDSGIVRVADGSYSPATTIDIAKQVCIESLNGASTTVVDGGGTNRCFNLGSSSSVISGFSIINGYTTGDGGGIYCENNVPIIEKCIIHNNKSKRGGGITYGTVNNCIISGNSAVSYGGGMHEGIANNCTISGNDVGEYGGGTSFVIVNNCTITGNRSDRYGGGVYWGTINNSIVWYNRPTNMKIYSGYDHYTCSPDAENGVSGNISINPMLLSASHIATNSPCRTAGHTYYTSGTDIDGSAWSNPPSMGCDEVYPSTPISGEILLSLNGLHTLGNGYSETYYISVIGNVSRFQVDFGNGYISKNSLLVDNQWENPGTYQVVITAWNDDYPTGISVTETVHVLDSAVTAIYVSTSGDDANDGSSWANAKATIQAGVDAQTMEYGLVLLSDGTFTPAASITVSNRIVVQSQNGASQTIIDGGGTHRGFTLGFSRCVISDLTITNCHGSAVVCDGIIPVVEHCIITGNFGTDGAGIYQGTANFCTISGNTASGKGGGMYDGNANHCVISGNTAYKGGGLHFGLHIPDKNMANYCLIRNNTADFEGGVSYGTINNCTIVSNQATHFGSRAGGSYYSTINNCIIWYNTSVQINQNINSPVAVNNSCSPGYSFLTPGFVGGGDYHLAATSDCVDQGSNVYLNVFADLDDTQLPLDGDNNGTATVDIGCYEYIHATADSDGDGLTDTEELNTHNTDPTNENTDGDDMDDGAELIADTDPNDSEDYFCVTAVSNSNPVTVYFNSSSSRLYSMLGCSNLVDGVWTNVLGNWPRAGVGGADTMQDTNVPAQGPYYRLEVKLP